MSKIIDHLKGYIELIIEGASLRDKLEIIIYFLSGPLHKLNDLFHMPSHKFRREITLKYNGIKLICGNDVSNVWANRRHFEDALFKYFMIKNGSFIDVGANVGKYSVLVSKNIGAKGKVLAIEPEKYNASLIERNIKLNSLSNVILEKVAASDKEQIKSFYFNAGSTGSSFQNLGHGSKIRMKCSKIDNLVKKNKITNVSLIKVDVEGAEIEAITGALGTIKKFKPQIIFEAWNAQTLAGIKKILLHLKYHINEICPENYIASIE